MRRTGGGKGTGFPGLSKFNKTGPANPDLNAYLNWKYAGNDTDLVQKVCRLKTGFENILGCNLFTGKTPSYAEAMTNMISPQHLAVWHQTGKIETAQYVSFPAASLSVQDPISSSFPGSSSGCR